MNEHEYPSNSNASKHHSVERDAEQDKKVEKVIKGTAKTKKKGGIRKAADSFFAEDLRSAGEHVRDEVFLPALKNTIVDTIINIIQRAVLGDTRRSSNRSATSYVSYSRYSDPRDTRREESRSSSRFDYDDIIFETYGDAQAVLDEMGEMIGRYDFVSIGDMYDMAQLTPPPYTATKYGWTSIRYAEIKRVGYGYIIKLPKARPRDY